MRLILKDFGLKTYEGVWVGFSKCGPSRNKSKFYKHLKVLFFLFSI